MFTVIFMCLWLSLGDTMANSVEPLNTHKVVDKGDDVTLSCRYKITSGTTNNYLHWYRQYPKSKPEFLLYISQSGDLIPNTPPRMTAKLQEGENKQVDLIISSAAVSDSALYYCALARGDNKIIFASGIKLSVESQEKKEPEYYKVKPKNTTDQESCLATRFTVHNVTEETWPLSGVHKAGAVLFDGEGYYSRLMLNDVNNCNETESTCGIKTEDSITFQSDAKTNFLALTIFWLRVLFFKTIAFNILMTVKVWLN